MSFRRHQDRRPLALMKPRSIVVLAWAVCLSVLPVLAYAAEEDSEGPTLEVVDVQYEPQGEWTAGLLRLFVRNESDSPVDDLTADLEVVDGARGATRDLPLVWLHLLPPVLPPAQVGELCLKPVDGLPTSGRFEVAVSRQGTSLTGYQGTCALSPLRVESVGFSQDLHELDVYVTNQSDRDWSLETVEFNGEPVPDVPALVNSPLHPGETGCVVQHLAEAPEVASYAYVCVRATDGQHETSAPAFVRAQAMFPVVGGALPFAVAPHLDPVGNRIFSPIAFGNPYPDPYVQIINCIAHAHGTASEAAAKFMKQSNAIYLAHQNKVHTIHICRAGAPQAYYQFGALADVSSFNIDRALYPLNDPSSPASYRTALHPFFWLRSQSRLACRPRPFMTTEGLGPDPYFQDYGDHVPSVDDTRFTVYVSLAAGSRGIIYRSVGNPPLDLLEQSRFARLNLELQALKPLLCRACPVEWASSSSSRIGARALLVGDSAAIVVLLDTERMRRAQVGGVYTVWPEPVKEAVQIELRLPADLLPSKVRTLYRGIASARLEI